MSFFHIPILEFWDALKESEYVGTIEEVPNTPYYNTGVFETFKN